MKRRLIFLYRYFTQSRRWRRWVNAQTLMALVVTIIFFTALGLTSPPPGSTMASLEATVAPTQPARLPTSAPGAVPTPTQTPIPEDYLITNPQSLGISLAAAMLVLIVLVGVLSFSPKKGE